MLMNPCQGCKAVCPGVMECKILFDFEQNDGHAKGNHHKQKAPPPEILNILKVLNLDVTRGKVVFFQSKRIPSKCIIVVSRPKSENETFKVERKLERPICLTFRDGIITKFIFPTERGIVQILKIFDK